MNKFSVRLCNFVFSALIMGCAPSNISTISTQEIEFTVTEQPVRVETSFPNHKTYPFSVYFAHGVCYGRCPIYSITIYGNGTVYYVGEKFVVVSGEVETHLTQEELDDLYSKIINLDIFGLEDIYPAQATDFPSVNLLFMLSGKIKSIEHSLASDAPDDLRNFECFIDDITNSYQWTGNVKEDSFCSSYKE